MDSKMVVERLQHAVRVTSANMFTGAGGPSWLGGNSGLQQQLNEATEQWLGKGNPEPIKGFVELLRTFGALSHAEADELRDAVDAGDSKTT
jgi:hypothetical protein